MALPNVEILWDTVAERIEGEGQVQSLAVKNVKTGKAKELSVDGVFVAVGIIPSSDIMKDVADCDNKGYLQYAGDFCSRGYTDKEAAPDSDGCGGRRKCNYFRSGIFYRRNCYKILKIV